MRILILEDDQQKLQDIRDHLTNAHLEADVRSVGTFIEYVQEINREQFDFLILDLVVPRHASSEDPVDIKEIVEVTRGDYKCKNFKTSGIVLTGFDEKAEDNFRLLNQHDFAVITYTQDGTEWACAIDRKIASLPTRARFDFVIICALEKEADGFAAAGFDLGDPEVLGGLRCRTVRLANKSGVLVTLPRMGLVTAAITATQAIQSFQPQVICMSGICGGVRGEVKVYDTVIAETCHQHDAGKWTRDGLKPEVYSVAIDHLFAQQARATISGRDFMGKVKEGILPNRNEFPEGMNAFEPKVLLAPASSGSAVLADEGVVQELKDQQRKCAIFEMESYAIYEAARLSTFRPKYFSAKTVVDDGSEAKSDEFHRIGCILSARVVNELLSLVAFQA